MKHSRRHANAHPIPLASLVAPGLLAAALAAPAVAQDGMLLNSATQQRVHQKADEGHRKHDFSPRQPPRNGRFIYGHWTPYNPPDPAQLPADVKKHVIVRGDTLWDLSGKYYQDNYFWPYIWEANPWVTYPHWIYPGDVLVIPPLMMLPTGDLAEEELVLPDILEGYYPAAGYNAIHCGHFIADPNIDAPGEIIATEADPSPIGLVRGDVVYVDVGAVDGVLPGDEFAIIYPFDRLQPVIEENDWKDTLLRHPRTGDPLGVVQKMAGRLKIILLGEEVSTALVTYSCEPVEVGYEIQPFTEIPIPLVRRTDARRQQRVLSLPNEGRGYVVYLEDHLPAAATGHLVSIDLGSKDGVIPGDIFRVFREENHDSWHIDVEHLGTKWDHRNARRVAKVRRPAVEKTVFGKQSAVPRIPPRFIGTIVVLYAEDHTATCRAIETGQEFYPGDAVIYEPLDTGLGSVAVLDAALDEGTPLSRQPSVPRRSSR